MTHAELLATLNSKQFMNSRTPETPYFALRAVVELHKPIQDKKLWCEGCRVEDDDWYSTEYPCPTIEAIEKELSA